MPFSDDLPSSTDEPPSAMLPVDYVDRLAQFCSALGLNMGISVLGRLNGLHSARKTHFRQKTLDFILKSHMSWLTFNLNLAFHDTLLN
jgi:hypothetical protein